MFVHGLFCAGYSIGFRVIWTSPKPPEVFFDSSTRKIGIVRWSAAMSALIRFHSSAFPESASMLRIFLQLTFI
jgi:hypothetical protein